MTDLVLLEEVDWFTAAFTDSEHWPCILTTCDFCYATACDDFRDGLAEPRAFYRLLPNGKFPGGEIVCSACVPLVDLPKELSL